MSPTDLNLGVQCPWYFCNLWHYLGKCNRGVMVAGSLKYLLPGREMNQEEEKKAIILGWCVEWVS